MHERWMNLALEQAKNGVGKTAPNPPVGAVIVRDNVLLGKGFHAKSGMPHAEREALRDALTNFPNAKNATAYVTLEPCSTHGRTPPCVDALLEAGISTVVYACDDANPAHAGRAKKLLEAQGVTVITHICEDEAKKILRPFFKVQQSGLPWVIVKTAMSLDGKITRPPHEGQWLSSATSRNDVQHLRAEVDMILTTGETVRKDHPALTIRIPELLEGRSQPWRLVLSHHPESLPKDAPLFTDENHHRTLIRSGDVEKILRDCVREQGIMSVLVEAGGELAAELLEKKIVDEMVCYLAPIITGGDKNAVAGVGFDSIELTNISWQKMEDDIKMRGLIKR